MIPIATRPAADQMTYGTTGEGIRVMMAETALQAMYGTTVGTTSRIARRFVPKVIPGAIRGAGESFLQPQA